MSVSFEIGSNPVIVANGNLGDYAELTRGETTTFEFYFQDGATTSLTVSNGESRTISDTEYYTNVTVENNATLTVSGDLVVYDTLIVDGTIDIDGSVTVYGGISSGVDGYTSLREYTEYTNGIKTEIDIDGEPTFRERTPDRDPVDSHLVKIRPQEGVDKHPALWGIILGSDDPTKLVHANARLDIELFVLGDTTDFASESEVRDALEA